MNPVANPAPLPEGWSETPTAAPLPEGWSTAPQPAPLPVGWSDTPTLAPVSENRDTSQSLFDGLTSEAAKIVETGWGPAAADAAVRLEHGLATGAGLITTGLGRMGEMSANFVDSINPIAKAVLPPERRAEMPAANAQPGMIAAGQTLKKWAEPFRGEPARDHTFLAQASEFAGTLPLLIASGPLAPLTGAALIAEQTREAAIAAGDSPEVADAKFVLGGEIGLVASKLPGGQKAAQWLGVNRLPSGVAKTAATVGAHATVAGATGAGLTVILQQLATGKINWEEVARMGAMTAVLGAIGGGLQAAQLSRQTANEADAIARAQKFGFKGATLDELRTWAGERQAAALGWADTMLIARQLGFKGQTMEELWIWHHEREQRMAVLGAAQRQQAAAHTETPAPPTGQPLRLMSGETPPADGTAPAAPAPAPNSAPVLPAVAATAAEMRDLQRVVMTGGDLNRPIQPYQKDVQRALETLDGKTNVPALLAPQAETETAPPPRSAEPPPLVPSRGPSANPPRTDDASTPANPSPEETRGANKWTAVPEAAAVALDAHRATARAQWAEFRSEEGRPGELGDPGARNLAELDDLVRRGIFDRDLALDWQQTILSDPATGSHAVYVALGAAVEGFAAGGEFVWPAGTNARVAEGAIALGKLRPDELVYPTGRRVARALGKLPILGPALPREEVARQMRDIERRLSATPPPRPSETPGERGVEAEMPPSPPGAPTANLYGRMPAAMVRLVPGEIDVNAILAALREVAASVGITTDFREGRFNQKALGIAKSWEEIVRLRQLANLPTAAHEIGHIVSKAVFGSMQSRPMMAATFPPAVNRELQALGKALYGSTKPVGGYTAEGFAELIRLWLTTDDAATKAPLATRYLETTLFPMQTARGPLPPLGAAMRKARDKFDLWRGMGKKARLVAHTKDPPGRLARLRTWAKEHLSVRGVAEEFTPFEEVVRAHTAVTGRRPAAGDNPFMLATAVRGTAAARLETWVEIGMTNFQGTITGPSLREAVRGIRPSLAADFELFLTLLQAVERFKQGFEVGMAPEDVIAQRDEFARDHPEFIPAAERWADWHEGVIEYARDAYPEMNGPRIDAIRARNPRYYGPLAKVLDPERVRSASLRGTGGGLHRFKGSGLPIKKLMLQSLLVAEKIIANAHRDRVFRSLVKMADVEGMGFLIEEVPRQVVMKEISIEKLREQLERLGVDTTKIPPDLLIEYVNHRDTPTGIDPITTVRTTSGTRWFQVRAEVLEILEGVHEPDRLDDVWEFLAYRPSRAFKMGTTGLRPSFALATNLIRDVPTFLLSSITGNTATRAGAYLTSLWDVVRAGLGGNQAPAEALVQQLGLQSSTFLGGDIAHARREASSLFHGRWYRRFRSPLETTREVLTFTEGVPRLAEMRLLGRELGWVPGQPLTVDQAVAMSVAYKRATVDFSAKGRHWNKFFRSIPYSGASVQGMRTFARAFRNEKGSKETRYAALRTILNGLTLITAPVVANWLLNKDEEWWQMLPWREKLLYVNIAKGKNIYQIPVVPEAAAAFMVFPVALLEAWRQDSKRPFLEAAGTVVSTLNPLDYPVLLKAAKEQWVNRIDYFDRTIVPRGELELVPGMQRSLYSSELAKALGDVFPNQVSPRRVDAAVRAVFGGAAADLNDAPSALMHALGLQTREVPREWEAADFPIWGRLARRGGKFSAQSQPLMDFWDDYTKYSPLLGSERAAFKPEQTAVIHLTNQERAYAIRLKTVRLAISMTLEMAARTPETEKRQALYQAASRTAARYLKDRPPD